MIRRPASRFQNRTNLNLRRFTMISDEDLSTLIQRNDHVNILRHVRVHQLREPELVVEHGTAWLGSDLERKPSDELVRLAAIEQICLAALDSGDRALSEKCLAKLIEAGVTKDSVRFRLLLARCMEAAGDADDAEAIYDDLLKENPANLRALRRKYCILRAQVGKQVETMHALNEFLQQDFSDISAWYEMAHYRMELGDYKGAAYALEEVLLGAPSDSKIHCELAECYATIGGIDNLMLARKHMAQSLELDPKNRRAQFGLVSVANSYLEQAACGAKKDLDDHEIQVAQELVKYGSEQVLQSYQGSPMFSAVKKLMKEYTLDL